MEKLLNGLHAVVAYLQGKKTQILLITGLVLSYLVTDHTITAQLGTLLQAILSVLAGGALVVANTQSYKDSQPLGALGNSVERD